LSEPENQILLSDYQRGKHIISGAASPSDMAEAAFCDQGIGIWMVLLKNVLLSVLWYNTTNVENDVK
jgi:hypothetical protein